MLIACPKCFMRYEVSLSDLKNGRKTWCSSCKHVWLQEPLLDQSVDQQSASSQQINTPTVINNIGAKKSSSRENLVNNIQNRFIDFADTNDDEANYSSSYGISYNSKIPVIVLITGSICVLLAMGLRASFGLFLIPMISDLGWGREIFAVALALQNLMWGVFQPFASAAAEKWGTGRIIALGGILYASGLYTMGQVTSPTMFHISAGLMIGAAQSGCALAVVLGAVGRVMPEEKRSWGLGIVMSAGGVGQFTVVPFGQVLLQSYNWSITLVILSALACIIIFCAFPLKTKSKSSQKKHPNEVREALSIGQAIGEAISHKGFWLLTIGFYVCGFHVAFIAIHLPAYLSDLGLPTATGAWAISVIGIFNIFGSYIAGVFGDKYRKKHLLSYLYLARAIIFLVFLLVPVSFTSVILFSASLGLLWLSTVPLTSSLVAQVFGTKYMGTIFGIVFLGHQIGSFTGIWLGGYLFDYYGTYMPIWWSGVVLGLVAAAMHWPINDKPLIRVALAH